jgi:long-subunit fatty acid transport protein
MGHRSRTVGRGGFIVVAALLVFTVNDAFADATHYQTLQLGERSRGMAAAYTGFAADAAAIWFNPAGLPFNDPRALQGSLSLVQRRTLDIEGALVSDGPDGLGGEDEVEDFNLTSRPTLPGFAAASFAVGKTKPELKVQIAISAFQTYNDEIGGDINFEGELGRTNSFQFFRSDRNTIFGAAVGFRPLLDLAVGIGVFANNRQLEHVETASIGIGGTQDPSQGSPCPTSPNLPFCIINARQIARDTVFTMSSWDLSFRIGLLKIFAKKWRFGLMFQPPGIRVGGKSNLRFELTDVRPVTHPNNPGLADAVFGERQFTARSPIPWELRLGVSYVITDKVVVAADLQLVGPVGEGSIAPDIVQLENRANTSGILFADSTKRVFTWNVSIGSEIQINRFLFGRLGFLTDRSGSPGGVPVAGEPLQPIKIDRYGFSASLGGMKDGKGLSVGVSMLFGTGTANGLNLTGQAIDDDDSYTRVPARERIFILSVGGDIGQTADVVKTRMKEKKKEQAIAAERELEREALEESIADEENPDLKALKQDALDARRQRDEAEKRIREADEGIKTFEQREKKNLDEADQSAIQGATQKKIETFR